MKIVNYCFIGIFLALQISQGYGTVSQFTRRISSMCAAGAVTHFNKCYLSGTINGSEQSAPTTENDAETTPATPEWVVSVSRLRFEHLSVHTVESHTKRLIQEQNTYICAADDFLKETINNDFDSWIGEEFVDDEMLPPPPPSLPEISTVNVKKKSGVTENTFNRVKKTPPRLLNRIPYKMTAQEKSHMEESIPGCSLKSMVDFYRYFSPYCVLDTEATGLGNGHKLTDVGAVIVQNFVRTGQEFQMYVNPECEVSYISFQITGLNYKFLQNYPVADIVCADFFKFIKNYPLVIHHAHFDLKLLNKQGKRSILLEEDHVIIDTERYVKGVRPNERSNLDSACHYYGIDTKKREKHGALIDAQLTADLFCKLIRDKSAAIPSDIQWGHLPRVDVENDFPPAHAEPAENFFHNLGITIIPETIRYCGNLYHPELCDNFPAILFPFRDMNKKLCGVLVRYLIKRGNVANIENVSLKQFYGHAEQSFSTIRQSDTPITVISDVLTSLVINSIIASESMIKDIGIFENKIPRILGILHGKLLSGFQFTAMHGKIIILFHERDKDEMEKFKHHIQNQLIKQQELSLHTAIYESTLLINYRIYCQDKTWKITNDVQSNNYRFFILTDSANQQKTLTYNKGNQVLMFGDTPVLPQNCTLMAPEKSFYLGMVTSKTQDVDIPPTQRIINAVKSAELLGEPDVIDVCDAFDVSGKNLPKIMYFKKGEVKMSVSVPKIFMKKKNIHPDLREIMRVINRFHRDKQKKA